MSGQPRERGRFVSRDPRADGETPVQPAARRRAIRGAVYGPGPQPRLVVDDTLADDTTVGLRIQDPGAALAVGIRLTPADLEALIRDLESRREVIARNAPLGGAVRAMPAPRTPPTGPLPLRRREARRDR